MNQENKRLELYSDQEVQQGIAELFSHEKFVDGMKNFLPKELSHHILNVKDEIKSIEDFQARISHFFLDFIKKISIQDLTSSGLEQLVRNKKYLFISNHRDIVLDSAYLNFLLFENKMSTSQIAIGDNLMKTRTSELLFRINKSFVVKRTGSPRELYSHSVNLSNYIYEMISENVDSIWLAQREGRAKDGNDLTQQGVLKMISLSGRKNLKSHLEELNIVPVSISYELDPTDLLKAKEHLKKMENPDFKKSFQEDVNYMLQGIIGQKGKVHFTFGNVLLEELDILDTSTNSRQQLEMLTQLIDDSIHSNFRLNPINFVAHDLLFSIKKYADKYSKAEWGKYVDYFENHFSKFTSSQIEDGKKYLLGIYANPVLNYFKK